MPHIPRENVEFGYIRPWSVAKPTDPNGTMIIDTKRGRQSPFPMGRVIMTGEPPDLKTRCQFHRAGEAIRGPSSCKEGAVTRRWVFVMMGGKMWEYA